ncbi:MAG: NAD(+) synthase [Planctomycetes bacterium]|nr:NAD(+) synthase [Planctomycetota bacterium]
MSTIAKRYSAEALVIDCAKETERICKCLNEYLDMYKKRGFVVALSGGIDSSVVGALCVQAVGSERVLGLSLPEKDSSADTLMLSKLVADSLGIDKIGEDITGVLESVGCYRRRDEAIKSVIPQYDSDYKCKIVLPGVLDDDQYRIFSVVVESPESIQTKARLSAEAYLGIVAASNFKQRIRKMFEYYHADRLNYAVTGTPNRQEYDQGFFVKNGDGSADIKPIAHLYKTQVYQLAKYLGVPQEIQDRPPTTDTYSMEQSQEEFYFSVPYDKMDLCLFGKNNNIDMGEVAAAAELTIEQLERVYKDIDSKRKATKYLQRGPVLIQEVF